VIFCRRGDRPAQQVDGRPFAHSDISTNKPQAKQATAKYQHHLTIKKINKISGSRGALLAGSRGSALAGCGAACPPAGGRPTVFVCKNFFIALHKKICYNGLC